MTTADLVRAIRRRSGLSQRALAERSGTSAAAICQYERGQRVPRVDTMQRIAAAGGAELELQLCWPNTANVDVVRNARILEDLLELADHLPRTSSRTLPFPPIAQRAG